MVGGSAGGVADTGTGPRSPCSTHMGVCKVGTLLPAPPLVTGSVLGLVGGVSVD